MRLIIDQQGQEIITLAWKNPVNRGKIVVYWSQRRENAAWGSESNQAPPRRQTGFPFQRSTF